MRIGVNTLFLLPGEVGGSEVYCRHLLDALRALDPATEYVLFTNAENHASFGKYERVPIGVRARSRARRILAEQTALVRAVHRARVDLLFSPGYTAPLRAPCPQVVAILDVQFCAYPQDFSWPSRRAQRFLVSRAARAAAVITTLSEFSRDEIHRRLGVPPERVVVTHLGVSPAFSEPQPCTRRTPFLLYVSNTYPHKNARRLAAAFLQIAGRIPHDLVIVGQPRAGEPPAHPRIHRIHHLPHESPELVGLFQACDLFVFPSLYEGFGLPVAEALAAGARVVAARAASIPEVAGDAATYFDPTREEAIAEAILAALDEPPETRRRFREAGRDRARQFTWETCAQQTRMAFDRALPGP